jgi:paraquat-inducible protein A
MMARPAAFAPVSLVLGNLALLAAFPIAWSAPLVRTGFLPFLDGTAVSVFSGIASLWSSDPALAALVAMFGVAMPMIKTLALAAAHMGHLGPGAIPALDILGKLSMTDVFLLAVIIVVAKGVGVGRVESAWGLYLFTACVLTSMLLSYLTQRSIRRSRA